MKSKINLRRNFGKPESGLPKLDLTLVQRESWQWFLTKGVAEELKAISPIDDFTNKNWQLTLGDHSLVNQQLLQVMHNLRFNICISS